jgi:hypothetical protein
MRVILRVVLASALLVGQAAAASGATIQDLIKLKAAGLSDDILIALIEADGSVFHLKADDVIAIRKEGLSEKVIMAMLATAIKKTSLPVATRVPAAAPSAAAQPQAQPPAVATPLVQINEQAEGGYDATVQPPAAPASPVAPVVINITQRVEQRSESGRSDAAAYPMYPTYPYYPYYPLAGPVYVAPAVPVKTAPTVFWGFGGQRRPGTWRDK